MANDSGIAHFTDEGATPAEVALFVGEWQIATESANSSAAVAKYALAALAADGTVGPFVVGTNTAAQAVITANAATAAGQRVMYWNSGKFNKAALVWPAGASLDTLDEIRAYFNGVNLQFGHTI